jgi:hypothetical protein
MASFSDFLGNVPLAKESLAVWGQLFLTNDP